jgi:hypothetical protein
MKRLVGGTLLVLVVGGIVLLIVYFDTLQHWLSVHTGTATGTGVYYAFWSGFGSDIGEATLVATVLAATYTGARKVNCHTKGCWRIGGHQLEGTPYHLCSHHHPDVPIGGATQEQILEHHRRAMASRAATSTPTTAG